jgi:glycosyltransferase involved in cell wall biosynthesis
MGFNQSVPLVSVLIPAYNQADLLLITLESVLNQTYPNIEIIVINDGSKDHTAEVMERYKDRIIGINKENQGPNLALKTGMGSATGPYITFLDHDDLMMPTKIEKQVRLLEQRPDINVVHCGYYHIDIDGNLLDRVTFLPEGDVLKELVCGNFIWSGAPLMRRKLVVDNMDLFEDDVWTGDTDFWLRLARTGNEFACLQEPLGKRRIFKGSMVSNVENFEEGAFEVLDRTFAPDSDLPADVYALKNTAYSNTYFWISCRYYEIGKWEPAQRTLDKAIELRPNMVQPPENLLHHLREEALSAVRLIDNPLDFANLVFDHLPSAAAVLSPYRDAFMSSIHTGLALRAYARGDLAEGRKSLEASFACLPNPGEQAATFSEMLAYYAVNLPIDEPGRFIELIFNYLPPQAEPLKRVRQQVIGDISITQAFLDYSAGRSWNVLQNVLTGTRNRPSWIWNRGVISIFAKSLLNLPKVSRS